MKNILNKLSNVVITVVVALIVYCVCVPANAVSIESKSYNTVVDKVVADTVYCTVNGQQYSFISDDEGCYYQGENINVTLENDCIIKAHSNAKVVQGTIVTNAIETDMFDCNDEKLYLYGVSTSNDNIVYFDTIDNSWQQGDNVNLTINNNGYIVGVE